MNLCFETYIGSSLSDLFTAPWFLSHSCLCQFKITLFSLLQWAHQPHSSIRFPPLSLFLPLVCENRVTVCNRLAHNTQKQCSSLSKSFPWKSIPYLGKGYSEVSAVFLVVALTIESAFCSNKQTQYLNDLQEALISCSHTMRVWVSGGSLGSLEFQFWASSSGVHHHFLHTGPQVKRVTWTWDLAFTWHTVQELL
jgi:hypothetical protein